MTIYLDNNATTQVDERVLAAMLPYLTEFYGNPSSMHRFGGQVAKAVQTAREQLADLIGALPSEIIFTSCGTEGNNAAIRSALATFPDRKHIITTQVEHACVLNLCKTLEKQGYRVTYLSVDSRGMLDLMELEAALTGDTAVVSTMYANNETGVIFPVEQIGALVKSYGALFHVDAVQAVGKIPIHLQNSTIDFLTLSGHKFHAPKGVGALFVRRGVRFRPLLIGGHQERNRRGGTENVAGIVGLGQAALLAQQHLAQMQSVQALRDHLEASVLRTIPDTVVNGQGSPRLPNTTNIGFKYIEGEAILLLLDREGICASSGSACTSDSLEPSHVLRAMGLPYSVLHGSIRFSLSRYTTEAEVEQLLAVLPGIVAQLRALSPFNAADQGWIEERTQAVVPK
ncbi:cysteine desulfurase NifS [Synechococcus sp. C9]|uniref:cysteine desulfurase NifS n=1 Tax=Synechococcus sp. C9 TaxID=102119 RepID=UPI001FF44B27|nr:cysteine desulfurase NifS [Synechococcus sp. C9]